MNQNADSAPVEVRDIPPAGKRFRPGDRILRLATVGAVALAFAFLIIAVRSGDDGPDLPRGTGVDSEPTEIREIAGAQADVVLQAIQGQQPAPPPSEAEAPPREVTLDEVELPFETPVALEPEGPSAAELAAQRKASSSLLVYSGNQADSPLEEAAAGLTEFGIAGIADTELGRRLVGTDAAGEVAITLTDLDTRILQGTLLSCVLETAISSAVPGMATCRIRVPAYSASGEYAIIPAGSRVIGEYQGGIEDGQARIFVLWTRLITPDGISVSLLSPGAGPLGRGGHQGRVDRKWGDRVAAALMVSLIADTSAAAVEGEFEATRSAATSAATDIVRSELAVRSELSKDQGERITIIVARDLEFGEAMEQRILRAGRDADVLLFAD